MKHDILFYGELRRNQNYQVLNDKLLVYVVKEEGTNICRIGCSKGIENVFTRHKAIEIANPRKLTLLGFFAVKHRSVKTYIMEYFEKTKMERSWFKLTEKDWVNIFDMDFRRNEIMKLTVAKDNYEYPSNQLPYFYDGNWIVKK
jgi:hypothetical protein